MLDALEAQGLAANTLVAYVSDHGELLGQHGMWWKCSFYEGSVRIPFMLAWPEHIPSNRRFARVTSLLDLVRTVLAAAGDTAPDLDGTDLMPLMTGAVPDGDGIALAEYAAHGTIMPARMVRHGRYKLNYYHGEPPELFDLEDDPDEFENLAAHPAYEEVRAELTEIVLHDWDPVQIDRRVRESQHRRRILVRGMPEDVAC